MATTDPTTDLPSPPGFGTALAFWLKLGLVSFGGPAGQIALMHAELVQRRRWISERRFLHALNYCMLLPGPEAQQLATYMGWLLHRKRGGLAAGMLFVLPSFVLLVGLSWVYMAFGNEPAIAGIFHGIKPAVTAIVVQATWRVGTRVLHNGWLAAIAAASFVAIFVLDVPFPLIVAGAALAGYAGGERMSSRAGHGGGDGDAAATQPPPALIDDHTPPPAHARFAWWRLARGAAGFAALWLAAFAGLGMTFGWQAAYARMAWFFTKAAFVTFGGAYAVLPYVVQGAVDGHHWLTAAQMIDGLALGETTPGPLIMVVAFVGFVGGWGQAVFGPDALFASGAMAAAIVTFFTFLPSFGFILLGAPLIESTRGQPALAAPLAGITAAVVGVIANLAVFFAWHVLWPHGPGAPVDTPSALILGASAIALLRCRAGVIPVVLACAIAGLVLQRIG